MWNHWVFSLAAFSILLDMAIFLFKVVIAILTITSNFAHFQEVLVLQVKKLRPSPGKGVIQTSAASQC